MENEGGEGSRGIDLLGSDQEKGEIASGESRSVASDCSGSRGVGIKKA